jgi:hypothetical protein
VNQYQQGAWNMQVTGLAWAWMGVVVGEEYLETMQEDDDRGFVGDALQVIGDHQLHVKILSKKSLNSQNQSD